MPTEKRLRDSKGRFVKRGFDKYMGYVYGGTSEGPPTAGSTSWTTTNIPFSNFKFYTRGHIDPTHPVNLYQRTCLKLGLMLVKWSGWK